MSSDPSRQPGRGWRPGPKPTERKTAPQRSWQKAKEQSGAASGPSAGKRWKVFLTLGCLTAVMVGILILIWLLIPPKPAYLLGFGATYADSLAVPHNAYGWQAVNDLTHVQQGATTFWGRE